MQCQEFDLVLEQSGGEPLPLSAQAHLETCGICRQLVGDLERITAAAGELPAEVEPPERVWISLRARLVSEGIIRTPEKPAGWIETLRAQFFRPALVGAALFIVVLGTALFSLRPSGLTLPAAEDRGGAQPVLAQAKIQLNTVEHRILSAAPGGSTEVDASLRQNLEIVNNFIAACEKTVQDDPQDDLARDYLSGAYQQKAELLATMQDHSTTGD